MAEVTSEPTRNVYQFPETDEATYTAEMLDKFVQAFMVPSTEDSLESLHHQFCCHLCPDKKQFVTLKGLKRHISKQHPGQPQNKGNKSDQQEADDSKRNYCTNAMTMCLVAHDFRDARKHADGARIIRLYKYLLLYFMAAGKTKYTFQSFRLLAGIKCFLTPRLAHELTWNRFVNRQGKVDSNIEPDRENEHDNRNQKDQIHAFHGKITEASVHRVSRAADKVKQIVSNHDQDSSVRKASGKHTDKEEERRQDVVSLAHHYHKECLFAYKPGRRFRGFPSFPRNYLASQIDTMQLQLWMRDSLQKLSVTNNFQRHKIHKSRSQ